MPVVRHFERIRQMFNRRMPSNASQVTQRTGGTCVHCDERLKRMQVPTLEQTVRFADHVADNHSWYKHLPFFPPGASFVFFPNPHAGRGVKVDGNQFIIYDIESEDYFAHHSRLSTADYAAQFGHWDYRVDDNPRMSDCEPGPWLYCAEGNHRQLLADDLKRQWSCRLTAFLKPGLPMFNLRAIQLEQEADMFLASAPSPTSRMLHRLFSRFGWVQAEDPAVERYLAVVKELRRAAGLHYVPSLFKFMESEASAQRQLLLATLHRVRAAWSAGQVGPT